MAPSAFLSGLPRPSAPPSTDGRVVAHSTENTGLPEPVPGFPEAPFPERMAKIVPKLCRFAVRTAPPPADTPRDASAHAHHAAPFADPGRPDRELGSDPAPPRRDPRLGRDRIPLRGRVGGGSLRGAHGPFRARSGCGLPRGADERSRAPRLLRRKLR